MYLEENVGITNDLYFQYKETPMDDWFQFYQSSAIIQSQFFT